MSSKLFLVLVFLGRISVSHSANILLIPMNHIGHVNLFLKSGQALVEAGHKVWIMATEPYIKLIDKTNVSAVFLQISDAGTMHKTAADVERDVLDGKVSITSAMPSLRKFLRPINQYCHEIMEHRNTLSKLQEIKFDLVIIDGLPPTRCLYTIPYYLDIPYITLTPIVQYWNAGLTGMPSVEPIQFLGLSDEMSFSERLINTAAYVALLYIPDIIADTSLIQEYVPHKPMVTYWELYRNSSLWLINIDRYCFDYHRVSATNFHYIGGITAQPAKPLPADLAKFMDDSTDGIIVMSFGSIPALSKLPHEMLMKFLEAFKRLPQKVVVRHEDIQVKDIPSNVKLMKWLPQNDLLGHAKTRLFITHGGNNGRLEALYHGVPMLVFPVGFDASYNAHQVEAKNLGKRMNLHRFDSDMLYDSIMEILTNDFYSKNVKKCSAIAHSMPSGRESLVFWVNHTLKFGASHLRGPALEMPVWRLLMLDVIIFFEVVIIVFVILALCCLRCCYSLCKRSNSKAKQE